MTAQFSTIVGLKRRAKHIQIDQGCKHHLALDAAAREGGFQNFGHARAALADRAPVMFSINLEQHWHNRRARAHGVEYLQVPLRQSLADLVKPHHLVGNLGGCRILGEHTLDLHSEGYLDDNAAYAVSRAKRVARTLQFMDLTGLKPSRAVRCYPRSDWQNRPPIADHDNCWYEPGSRQFVLSTEPYPTRAERSKAQMDDWCNKHGFTHARVNWGSIYGHTTELWLATKAGTAIDLHKLASSLEAEPTQFADE